MDIIDQLSSAFKEKGIKITFGSHDGSEPGGGKLTLNIISQSQ